MAIKTISLSHLAKDPQKVLNEYVESEETLIVEMPDQRLLAIQTLDPNEDDSLMEELLESNPEFQALVAKSKASPRKPFSTEWRSLRRFVRRSRPKSSPAQEIQRIERLFEALHQGP